MRRNVPWGAFKGNMLRNGIVAYRDPTDALPQAEAPPARTALLANLPNPFNPSTTLRFDLGGAAPQRARLRVYDVEGRLVRTVLDRTLSPGRYAQPWDGRDDSGRSAASGVYLYRLDTPAEGLSRKMVLVR